MQAHMWRRTHLSLSLAHRTRRSQAVLNYWILLNLCYHADFFLSSIVPRQSLTGRSRNVQSKYRQGDHETSSPSTVILNQHFGLPSWRLTRGVREIHVTTGSIKAARNTLPNRGILPTTALCNLAVTGTLTMTLAKSPTRTSN